MNRSHHIVPQDKAPEASWPVEERTWAFIRQGAPRSYLPPLGHRIAFYAGAGAALVVLLIEALS